MLTCQRWTRAPYTLKWTHAHTARDSWQASDTGVYVCNYYQHPKYRWAGNEISSSTLLLFVSCKKPLWLVVKDVVLTPCTAAAARLMILLWYNLCDEFIKSNENPREGVTRKILVLSYNYLCGPLAFFSGLQFTNCCPLLRKLFFLVENGILFVKRPFSHVACMPGQSELSECRKCKLRVWEFGVMWQNDNVTLFNSDDDSDVCFWLFWQMVLVGGVSAGGCVCVCGI